MSLLRRLDEAWVPRAGAALHDVRARLGATVGPPRAALTTGVRRAPGLASAVGAVLLIGAVAAATRSSSPHSTNDPVVTQRPGPDVGTAITAAIGPRPGESVVGYRADAAHRLAGLLARDPTAQVLAAVDLTRNTRPGDLAAVVGTLPVVRVYLRVPSTLPTRLVVVRVAGLAELPAALAQEAVTSQTSGTAFARAATALPAHDAARSTYQRYASAGLLEARQLRAGCACVFTVVVRGSAQALTQLARNPHVRVVDPAAPGVTTTALSVTPLPPETTGVVGRSGTG